jgi:hypothetical protein
VFGIVYAGCLDVLVGDLETCVDVVDVIRTVVVVDVLMGLGEVWGSPQRWRDITRVVLTPFTSSVCRRGGACESATRCRDVCRAVHVHYGA